MTYTFALSKKNTTLSGMRIAKRIATNIIIIIIAVSVTYGPKTFWESKFKPAPRLFDNMYCFNTIESSHG